MPKPEGVASTRRHAEEELPCSRVVRRHAKRRRRCVREPPASRRPPPRARQRAPPDAVLYLLAALCTSAGCMPCWQHPLPSVMLGSDLDG
ncbi:hypothetical protein ACP4OV_005930 [Aristida adscensionis]